MKKPINLITKLIALFLLLAFSTITHAEYEYWEEPAHHTSYSPVQIDIVGDRGKVLNQYTANSNKKGVQRTYLEAIKGKQYKLRIRNNSNRRVGVVIAVDGRNVLTGKKSWLGKNEKMYILNPHETTSYKGWRTSKNHVNRFFFTSAGNSYSNAWGDHSAMGVIAVAVFNEKPQRHYYKKHKKYSPNAMGKSRSGYLAEESTGTGFGHEEYSPTIKVNFKAENRATAKHFLKYEWRKTLCKRGVISCDYHKDKHPRNRFWPQQANNGYAAYPPGYNSHGNHHGHYKKQKWNDQFKKRWDTNYTRGW